MSAEAPAQEPRRGTLDGLRQRPKGSTLGWRLTTGVMGGRSSGGPTVADGQLEFQRHAVRWPTRAAFSSVRSVGRNFDLATFRTWSCGCAAIRPPLQLRLATDARYRGMPISYRRRVRHQTAGEWTEVRPATGRP